MQMTILVQVDAFNLVDFHAATLDLVVLYLTSFFNILYLCTVGG